jgi:hypothetical protein
LWPGALEDGATTLGNSGSGGWGSVDGARAGLRHDDAADGWACGDDWLCRCYLLLRCDWCFGCRGWSSCGRRVSGGCGDYRGGCCCCSFNWWCRWSGFRRCSGNNRRCGWVSYGHGRACNHRADGRFARDSWCGGWDDDVCLRARQRNDATRLWSSGCLGLSRCCCDRCGCHDFRHYCRGWDGCRSCDDGRRARWRGFGSGVGLLALEDGLKCVAGFGDLGEVKLRLCLDWLPACAAAPAAVLEVLPDPLGLVVFDGAGVGLSGHANCFKRVQNWPALYFQFPCQIVDSNFAHPSLFVLLPCALSCSYQPHGGLNLYCKCYP